MSLGIVQPAEDTASVQFISFTEGSDDTEPSEPAFPLHVLAADHNLNHIDGGDPAGGFDPFLSDILVFPSSEYWESLLNGARTRPYVDLSISDQNTVRIPTAIHNYDLYVDAGKFYEDVTIDGSLDAADLTASTLDIAGSTIDANGNLWANDIQGVTRTRLPILAVTSDMTLGNSDTGTILQVSPSGSSVTITLPVSMDTGFTVTVNNLLAGKTTAFSGSLNAVGNTLSGQYSAATVYYDGSAWYAIGDLV